MSSRFLGFFIICLAVAGPALAQPASPGAGSVQPSKPDPASIQQPVAAPVAPQPPVAAATVGAAQPTMLPAGTPIRLRTTMALTTKGKHLKEGDRFTLEVAEPVSLGGAVVIPVGSAAVGEVTSVRNKGMWGKSGNIETRMISVSAYGRTMRITGAVGDKGVKAGGGAIATSAIVFLPAGFFMTGTSAVIPIGSAVQAILSEDVPVAIAGIAPVVPLAIPAQVPVVPVSAVVQQPAAGMR